ncbi:Pyridoxal phosphate-dependent transferase [Aspergillus affinis]|uniref:Pyridoxal phosphate-dependent transferase n=1 Tax=Aspergillus affinis TaxID=1070780 RepID=UPI0022FE3FF6|nr:Pyridoxal phosphate-dependent transferase [Aspergillus affinis]KAI9040579.1 Pyridoxal phosphate-dependent transferase [Aspergillus affinis]
MEVETNYNADALRTTEYPMLKGEVYLDHTGTTVYAQSALKSFVNEMSLSLLGNPHSDSRSSRLSTLKVEEVRKSALSFFGADPEHFDLVFVMNATAAVKLVLDALKDLPTSQSPEKTFRGPGLWFGYHLESHTSIVGGRELADAGHHCFLSDEEVDSWLRPAPFEKETDRCPGQASKTFHVGLFAYPGQSNMTGRRLPLAWPGILRQSEYGSHHRVFTLLDAAALASTASLDCFRDPDAAPDFTAVSFYKIFGFPDLGGLIIRKQSAHVLLQRSYFGGGTVEMVTCSDQPWHSRKPTDNHEALEDGTVPFHNIIALGCALATHEKLYGSQDHVSRYTTGLTAHLAHLLSSLRHPNGVRVCQIYQDPHASYSDSKTQGSIVAFNVRSDDERWLRLSHVEEAANEHRIHLRTGTVCNPGGLAKALNLEQWELFQNYTAGVRCGCRSVLVGHKPSGIIRVSLGAMSTLSDVESCVKFIHSISVASSFPRLDPPPLRPSQTLYVHQLIVYPIKGCAGYLIPEKMSWNVSSTGLQWDRQWCLVNLETGLLLDQKAAPHLLLIQPEIYTASEELHISVHHSLQKQPKLRKTIKVPLADLPPGPKMEAPVYWTTVTKEVRSHTSDTVHQVRVYQSPDITSFFTTATGVPCTLARIVGLENFQGSSQWRKEPTVPRTSKLTAFYNKPCKADQHPVPVSVAKSHVRRSRSLPVALTETLRVNALLYSDTIDRPTYCLLRIEGRGQDESQPFQFTRMKAMEITAERQSPEIFKATSTAGQIVWKSDNVDGEDDRKENTPSVDRIFPIYKGQMVQF